MYCMHAQKEASEAPRTHFRACKTSWGHAPRPPPTIYIMGPTFYICPGPLQSSRRPWIQGTQPHVCKQQQTTHTVDVTHHTPDNQTTNLTPHSSVNIQHPHVFEYTTTESTSHQQQWVLLSS